MSEKEKNQSLPRQIIVVRKDLNMSAGKLASQVAHASLACITNRLERNYDNPGGKGIIEYIMTLFDSKEDKQDIALDTWLTGRFTKIIVYVKSEEQLKNIQRKAEAKGLPNALIEDAGFTEFGGVKTFTTLGIGPCYPEDLEGVTSKLRLFDGEVIPR